MRLLLVVLLVPCLTATLSGQDPAPTSTPIPIERTVTDSQGRLLEVMLLSSEGEKVTFRRQSDGKTYTLELTNLSESDQKFIRHWRTGAGDSPEAGIVPGPAMNYAGLAFRPEVWQEKGTDTSMIPWKGREVVFLARAVDYDAELMSRWVRQLDAGWALFRDLTGREPAKFKVHETLPVIAAVPGSEYSCGAGCGYLGSTGIELAMFHSHNYPDLVENPEMMPHYVYYEMGRNFYTFGDRHSCFTTGFAVFMRYICMDSIGCVDLDSKTREVIESLESGFQESELGFIELFTNAGSQGEKGHRIKDRDGNLIMPSDQPCTYASAMLRLHRECGGNEWLRRFFALIGDCPEVAPDMPETALIQCWHWFLSASFAARRDLSPIFADEWGLDIEEPARRKLAAIDWKRKDLAVGDLAEWLLGTGGLKNLDESLPKAEEMSGSVGQLQPDDQRDSKPAAAHIPNALLYLPMDGPAEGQLAKQVVIHGKPLKTQSPAGVGLSFDGVDDFVDLGAIDLPDSWTLSFWGRIDRVRTHDKFFKFANGLKVDAVEAQIETNGQLLFWLRNGFTMKIDPLRGEWRHYALRVDKRDSSLFLDGKAVESFRAESSIPVLRRNFCFLGAGSNDSGKPEEKIYLKGAMDEVLLINRRLTIFEIKDLAAPPSDTGPSAGWVPKG